MRDRATRQHGRISWAQLDALGVPGSAVNRWVRDGYLSKMLPRVYAVGHLAASVEARLWEVILYAGPGAMVSHATAAHWLDLIAYPPPVIHVTTPRKGVRSLTGRLQVHYRRTTRRILVRGVPATSITCTVLDLAAGGNTVLLRRALASLDYQRKLDIAALQAVCGRGIRGSVALRRALVIHQPAFAYTKSELENRFVQWCERWRIPVPRCNQVVHGLEVDAYWPDCGLVVELDGYANHATPAQLRTDRGRELRLRRHGIGVLRYDWNLLERGSRAVRDDLRAQLAQAHARHVAGRPGLGVA